MKNKIAYVISQGYSNDSNGRVFKEIQSLAKVGPLTLFSIRLNEDQKKNEKEGSVSIERVDFPILKKIGFPLYKIKLILPFYTLKVLLRIIKFSPRVVVFRNLYSAHIGLIAKKLLKAKCIYDSGELFVDQNERNSIPHWLKTLIMKYEKFIVNRVDAVIQATPARARQFEKYYGVKAIPIMNKAIPASVNQKIPGIMKQFVNIDKKIIGYVGAINPHRGLEQIIDAVSAMKNIIVVFIGPKGKWGTKFINENKDRISWIPPVAQDEVTTAIKVFDIGITIVQNSCLSYYYSCPTKVWETIVAGVPQISSNFPEIEKLLLNNHVGPLGRVINPSDVKELKRTITEMLNNSDELDKYKNNCIKIQPYCTWESEEKKMLALLSLLLMKKPP